MASFDPIPTMSFTKWFSIMDYAVSLGFKMTELGIHITTIANSDILKGNERIGLCGIRSSNNGASVSHVIGWDMEDKLRYNNSTMRNVLTGSNYNTIIRKNSPTLPQIPGVWFGSMGNTYSELKGQWELQSSIMFALGEWFDGVQAQVSTPSVFNTIDFTDSKGNGKGALPKALKLIVPFEKAFDDLNLPKKLLKQLIDPQSGLLAQSSNPSLRAGKDWLWNTPYISAFQLASAKGIAYTNSDREKMLKYFYNQGNYIQQYNDPNKKDEYSGARPFRYYGYPQSSILGATKYPQSSLSTISDLSAILTFQDKVATPLWMIRSLSQFGTAKKVSSRMRVNKTTGNPVAFPNLVNKTTPDYGTLGYWTVGQSSPVEFASIISGVVNDPSPLMATQLGATPKRGAPPVSAKKTKPTPSANP